MRTNVLRRKDLAEAATVVPDVEEEVGVTEGSGNVFADLGLSDAVEQQTKARLSTYFEERIAALGITQEEAARCTGLSQSDVSKIARGIVRGFSLDRLFRCLCDLGMDVEIAVHPAANGRPKGRLQVDVAPLVP